MKIVQINVKDSEGFVKTLEKAELTAGKGLLGDHHKEKPGRALSMLDSKSAQQIALEPGLCTNRFIPNILLSEENGIDAGKQYKVGGAVIRITQKGKRCFTECPLFGEGKSCELSRNVLFADVVMTGLIKKGDSLIETVE
ncbi:MAG: hypothetical protein WCP73_03110 [Eubacteriales bacterium]